MKHRIKLLTLLFFLAFINNAICQTTRWDLYTPLRNKLLHIILTKDSVVFRKCSFDIDMRDYGYIDRGFNIEKEVNGFYIVSEKKDLVKSYYLFKFSPMNEINNLNIVSLNNEFSTLSGAEEFIHLIEYPALNIILLTKKLLMKFVKVRI